MKRFVFILMSLIGCMTYPNTATAQRIKDAFVLVDVSGTMRHQQINNEAKNIISDMLQGQLNISNYSGWQKVHIQGVSSNCPLISQTSNPLTSLGGKVCIMPFGNMSRVEDYRFVDMSNFQSSFSSLFPSIFNDSWTYITLAKAYTVKVALENGLSKNKFYMIIYSDGAAESQNGNVGYTEDYQTIIDHFGTDNDSYCKKEAILRKERNGIRFDIEIWTMGPIPEPVCSTCNQSPCICKTPPPVDIINPANGKSPQDPIRVNTKESVSLKWKNAKGKAKINIQCKNGTAYTNIPPNERDNHYICEQKGSSAEITFYKALDYRVIIANDGGKDIRYFEVTTPIWRTIAPMLIIILLAIGGVLLWKMLAGGKEPNPNPGPSWDNGGNSSRGTTGRNGNDDW